MKRHAKASSAGSTMGAGKSRNPIRRALATRASSPSAGGSGASSRSRLAVLALAIAAITLALGVSLAGASKGVLTTIGTTGDGDGQFGTFPGGANAVAVNKTGNGTGADQGDVYVIDNANDRIQQFDQDGAFIRAFGWGVEDGSDAFQICASGCQAAVEPSLAGAAGALPNARAIAVDQDTGNLFVNDQTYSRVNVFSPDGSFQGAFGYGVDTGDTAVELCTAASTCQAGTTGNGAGQLGGTHGTIAVGSDSDVYVADRTNRRIARYAVTLDGSDVITAASFTHAFGWGVDTNTGAFEVCTTASGCNAGVTASPGNPGQFATNQPVDVAVDSTDVVYAVESTATGANPRRVHRFTPQVGPPEYAPSAFADAELSATANATAPTHVAIGAADSVFVVKPFEAGTGTPPAAVAERRILELDSTGVLIDTHLAGGAINAVLGLATAPASGRLYVASTTGANRVFVLGDVLAPAASATLGAVDARSATFEGTVDPNGSQTNYRFEYRRATDVDWTKTHNNDLSAGAGGDPTPVSHTQPGLEPNTAYQFRLVATKPFGNPGDTSAPVPFSTDPAAPTIEMAATTAAEDRAVMRSRIDPESSPTSFHYQWGPTNAYGNTTPETAIGSGETWALAQQQITGLSPNTTYHYRLIAESDAGGIATGPDRTLTTGPGLAENRAYELVSPADKDGHEVISDATRTRAAADGDALQFTSIGAFGDVRGTGMSTDYIAQRSDDPDPGHQGWGTHSITPLMDPRPFEQIFYQYDAGFLGELSDDLSAGVMHAKTSLEPGAGANVADVTNLFLRRDLLEPGPGTYELLSDASEPVTANPSYVPIFNGASTDFDHISFTTELNLTSDAPAQPPACTPDSPIECRPRVYEVANGQLRLAGLVPPGTDTTCAGLDCVAPIRSIAGSGVKPSVYNPRTISTDGSRIFLTVADDPSFEGNGAIGGNLYVRENGASTTKINVSERTIPDTPQPAQYQNASTDGRYVFLTTDEKLTDDDIDTDIDADLYRVDIEAPAGQRLMLVSVDEDPRDPGGSVGSVLGASDDGEYVYFTANSQLVAGGPKMPTNNNLIFAWHDGVVSYVGALSGDTRDQCGNTYDNFVLCRKQSRVTPSGRHLVFLSAASSALTGNDPGADCNAGDLRPCQQVYIYSAEANGGKGALACASCRPGGDAATRDAVTTAKFFVGGASRSAHQNTAITPDGRYVFFSSAERLLPVDTNGVSDAYLYDTAAGELRLLSSGEDSDPSFFLDASRDGRDIFISTREQLTGWDVDNSYDVYDVRVDGGFPEPPPPPPSCQGDACQPAPTVLSDSTPSSSGVTGPGSQVNRGAKPRKCPKGKRRVKARGKTRCVKRKGAKRKDRAKHNRRASR